jgi:Encapsulating protein for peroxidase
MELTWDKEEMSKAQKIIVERFAMNSVAGHLSLHSRVDDIDTTVRRSRFDFNDAIVIDREVLSLYEPFSLCNLSKAQVDEFSTMHSEEPGQTQAIATLTRAASRLARWHDVLFFRGLVEGNALKPPLVHMPAVQENPPQSLYEAALEAETQEGSAPVFVSVPLNEGLVAAVYEAVLRLETRGYFTAYHLVLGETLWRELHRPTGGSLVLSRDRIEHTLMGGRFYRTTTLPNNEALLVSLDGSTFDCVIAGDPTQHPRFEFLRVVQQANHEELFLFRIRERFAPRVRENRAIVRLQIQQPN